MKENPLREITRDFALKAIAAYKALQDEQYELVLSIQLLHFSSKGSANAAEAKWAKAKRDSFLKVSAARKKVKNSPFDQLEEEDDQATENWKLNNWTLN